MLVEELEELPLYYILGEIMKCSKFFADLLIQKEIYILNKRSIFRKVTILVYIKILVRLYVPLLFIEYNNVTIPGIYFTGICGSAFTALNEEIDATGRGFPSDKEDNNDKKNNKESERINNEENTKTKSKEYSSNRESTDKVENNVQGISVQLLFSLHCNIYSIKETSITCLCRQCICIIHFEKARFSN